MPQKIKLKAPKPRNEFVQQMRFRKSGAHDKTKKALRKQEKQNFQKESREFFQAA